MKLKNKIQNSMTLVVMTTLLIAYVITTFVVYRQTLHLMENEIHQEADYIKTAIEKTGESYLKEMDDVRRTTRVTVLNMLFYCFCRFTLVIASELFMCILFMNIFDFLFI